MEQLRKPFQGVGNIIRFNWHFYVLSFVLVSILLFLNSLLKDPYSFYTIIICLLIIGTTVNSLLVSMYVYDLSDLYQLTWLDQLEVRANSHIVNIHAGFDETSALLCARYPDADLAVYDFYDPLKHTEISIKRARKAYAPYPGTKRITTSAVPLKKECADMIFLIFSAHEVRRDAERTYLFTLLKQVIRNSGKIVVTEHLRDIPNFLAYNIGFFHFFTESSWCNTFEKAGLRIISKVKITPFVTTFILEKNGHSS